MWWFFFFKPPFEDVCLISLTALRVCVRSRCWDACMVVDGGTSFEFNDGAIATISLHEEDLLKTVLLDDWTCELLHQAWTWNDRWRKVKNGSHSRPEDSSVVIDEAEMNLYFYGFTGRMRIFMRCLWGYEVPAGCPRCKSMYFSARVVYVVLARTSCHSFCCHCPQLFRKKSIYPSLLVDRKFCTFGWLSCKCACNQDPCSCKHPGVFMMISLQLFYFHCTWCIFLNWRVTKRYSHVMNHFCSLIAVLKEKSMPIASQPIVSWLAHDLF